MTNPWHWWQEALEGRLGAITSTPEQGFYKAKRMTKKVPGKPKQHIGWDPVAIWQDEDGWQALRMGKPVHADEVWSYCCRNPVADDDYETALAGGGWAVDEPTVAAANDRRSNSEGVDEDELLKDEIESAKAGIAKYAKITSDDGASKAQALRSRLNELSNKADKRRDLLKRPHLDAGNAIDRTWMPLVKDAKEAGMTLRRSIEAWETIKLNERRREEAAAAALTAPVMQREEQTGSLFTGTPEPAPAASPVAPAPQSTVKGSSGRAATVGTIIVVKKITDQDALYMALRDHEDVVAVLFKLATSLTRAGHKLAGVETEEKAKVS